MRNMKKAALIALPLCVLLSTQVFAGEWKRDERGWWYQREDGAYPINRWEKWNRMEIQTGIISTGMDTWFPMRSHRMDIR